MSSSAALEPRYPKRRRTAVSYNEAAASEDEFDEVSDPTTAVSDNSTAAKDEAESSDNDEDWTLEPNSKKRSKTPIIKKPKTKKPKPFPFMKLPPELRDNIYKLVVGSPDGIVAIEPASLTNARLRRTLEESYKPVVGGRNLTRLTSWTARKRYRNLRLLCASKEIYEEAAPVLYTKQKFVFLRLSALQTFLLLVRPETLDRLVHVHVHVGETEWTFMPGVASQLLQLHYLQTLKISGLGFSTSSRNFSGYLNSTERAESTWPVTLESYDKMKAIKLARDMYPFMYPFFNGVIRAGFVEALAVQPDGSKELEPEPASSSTSTSTQASDADTDEEQTSLYKPLVGVKALVHALELDESADSYGGWYHDCFRSPSFAQFKSKPMTDDRRSTRRAAMKLELLDLMGRDSF
ncbi:hypothetical protein N0V82_004415 [Gnomoniopsis sp. IMI 355080]|nr:hypothetical protein N0V82_004415 [Gnomoniopsis sp. IMI 355080]